MLTQRFALVAIVSLSLVALSRAAEPVHSKNVTYSTPDAKTVLQLDVVAPQGEGPFPAVVCIHGGGWYSGDRKKLLPIANDLARNKIVAVVVSYRLAPEHPFPAALHDVKTAVRWARANAVKYHIDSDRIATLGYSAGGHLASLLGTTGGDSSLEGDGGYAERSSRVCSVVAIYPPTDLEQLYRMQVTAVAPGFARTIAKSIFDGFLGGSPESMGDKYLAASPIRQAKRDAAPTLLIHGSADNLVPLEQSTRYAERLSRVGAAVELLVLPQAGHGFGSGSGGKNGERADRAVLEYLRGQFAPQVASRP